MLFHWFIMLTVQCVIETLRLYRLLFKLYIKTEILFNYFGDYQDLNIPAILESRSKFHGIPAPGKMQIFTRESGLLWSQI